MLATGLCLHGVVLPVLPITPTAMMKRLFALLTVTILLGSSAAQAQQLGKWLTQDFDLFPSSGLITAMTVHDGVLYVAGSFDSIGGDASHGVAYYDHGWHSLPSGVNGSILSIAVGPDSGLYVAGLFSNAGSVAVQNIAKWDGSSWQSVGGGIASNYLGVAALAFNDKGELYAGGNFDSAGSVPANNIAMWDGVAWHALDSGIMNWRGALPVFSIASYKNDIYVAGYFEQLGDKTPIQGIAKWDGEHWSSLNTGSSGVHLNAVTIDSAGTIYISGELGTLADDATSRVARYDGTAWHRLDDTLDFYPGYLAASYDRVFVGHLATSSDGVAFHDVAQSLDGNSWSVMEGGVNKPVTAMAMDVSRDLLYVAGYFDTVNGVPIHGLARYLVHGLSVTTSQARSGRIAVMPNPSTEYVTLSAEKKITAVEVCDELGRVLFVTKPTNSAVRIPLHGAPSGMLTYRLYLADGTIATGKLVHE